MMRQQRLMIALCLMSLSMAAVCKADGGYDAFGGASPCSVFAGSIDRAETYLVGAQRGIFVVDPLANMITDQRKTFGHGSPPCKAAIPVSAALSSHRSVRVRANKEVVAFEFLDTVL